MSMRPLVGDPPGPGSIYSPASARRIFVISCRVFSKLGATTSAIKRSTFPKSRRKSSAASFAHAVTPAEESNASMAAGEKSR